MSLKVVAAERGCGVYQQDVAGRVAARPHRLPLQLHRSGHLYPQAQVASLRLRLS